MGNCVVVDPPPNGCRPGAGVYLRRPMYAPGPPLVTGYWLKGCQTAADCSRPAVDPPLYNCDPILRACIPAAAPSIAVNGHILVEPFCNRDVKR